MYLVNCNMDCLKHEMSKLKVDLSFGLSHLYNPGQANLQFSHFDTQILCGIKFGNFKRYEMALLFVGHFGSPE